MSEDIQKVSQPIIGERIVCGNLTKFYACQFERCVFVGFTKADLMAICDNCYFTDCRIEAPEVRPTRPRKGLR